MDDAQHDALTGTVTALMIVVSQLVKVQAGAQPNPPEWLEAMRASCLEGLRTLDRQVGGDAAGDATLEAAADIIARILKPTQVL